jgi:tetratricopeptide (TPR) repeat protein
MRFLAFAPRGLWTVRLEAESRGLDAAQALGDRAAEMTLLRRRADTFQMCGRWEESETDLRACVALAKQSGEPVRLGEALCGLGRACKLRGALREALAFYDKALPLVRGAGRVEAVVECNLSQINVRLGRFSDALAHAEREWNLHRDMGDPLGEGYALHDIAVAYQSLGNHYAATSVGERAVALLRITAAAESYLAAALQTVAISYEASGDEASAARRLQEAAHLLAALDDFQAGAVRERARILTLACTG